MLKSNLDIVITDFGLSHEVTESSNFYGIAQNELLPLRWYPPETLKCRKLNQKPKLILEKLDVWSFGITVHEIFSKGSQVPYYPLMDSNFQDKIINEHGRLKKLPSCPKTVYEILLRTWDVDYNLRGYMYIHVCTYMSC